MSDKPAKEEQRADERRGATLAELRNSTNERLILVTLARILDGDGLDWRLADFLRERAGVRHGG